MMSADGYCCDEQRKEKVFAQGLQEVLVLMGELNQPHFALREYGYLAVH